MEDEAIYTQRICIEEVTNYTHCGGFTSCSNRNPSFSIGLGSNVTRNSGQFGSLKLVLQ